MRSLLEDAAHTVHCVPNGKEAIDQVETLAPDLVVTDLRMPEMNGLELVQAIAESRSQLPSVVVTARGSEALAVDALALGAANFVPKNSLSTLLNHVVARTIEMSTVDRLYASFSGQLLQPEFSLTLSSQMTSIQPATLFVIQALAAAGRMNATQRIRIGTAIASAIFNAICYGNLEIGDDDTSIARMLAGDQSGEAELNERADQEPYCDRTVELKVSVADDDTRILVSHDGPGRMTRMRPAPGTPESFELEQCRGLMLMTSFMDDVVFHNQYSEVIMVKQHHNTSD